MMNTLTRPISQSLLLGLMLVSTTAIHGVSITLFNTGIDGAGALLADGAADAHYTLVEVPVGSGYGSDTFVADSSKFPLSTGDWMPNSSASKWIGPQADQSTFPNTTGSGVYKYRTTFDLTGLDTLTTVISGQWSTDNPGLDILINGISTGITHSDVFGAQFKYFSPFLIQTGFVPGLNTLDFVVWNIPLGFDQTIVGENPTGLRVEISGTADRMAAAVPDASFTLTLLAISVAGLFGIRRENA
jgi:hypothetical protein